MERFKLVLFQQRYQQCKKEMEMAYTAAGQVNVLLYCLASPRMRRVLGGQTALSRLLDYGEATVSIDFGPVYEFKSAEDVLQELTELQSRHWRDQVNIEVDPQRYHSSVRLKLTYPVH